MYTYPQYMEVHLSHYYQCVIYGICLCICRYFCEFTHLFFAFVEDDPFQTQIIELFTQITLKQIYLHKTREDKNQSSIKKHFSTDGDVYRLSPKITRKFKKKKGGGILLPLCLLCKGKKEKNVSGIKYFVYIANIQMI